MHEPQRGSVPKPNVVPRLPDYVGLVSPRDDSPNGVAATFAHVSIIIHGSILIPCLPKMDALILRRFPPKIFMRSAFEISASKTLPNSVA